MASRMKKCDSEYEYIEPLPREESTYYSACQLDSTEITDVPEESIYENYTGGSNEPSELYQDATGLTYTTDKAPALPPRNRFEQNLQKQLSSPAPFLPEPEMRVKGSLTKNLSSPPIPHVTESVHIYQAMESDEKKDLRISERFKIINTYSKPLEMRIENFKEKQDAAKAGKGVLLKAVSVYTACPGYRFFLEVFPNGNRSGKHNYVSAYVAFERGRYDKELQWPMKLEIAISLKHRPEGKCYFREFPKEEIESIKRPGFFTTHSIGYDEFISNDLVDEYVIDGALTFVVHIKGSDD